MFRLFKSEKFLLHTALSKTLSSYRQVQVYQFQNLEAALAACDSCNAKADSRHYILNESREEYYEGAWID